ncbi:paraquat-inducible protein A [Neptuniibacter sp. CAU 1671]|uniref:paraquat-inducible protein A n=1 Tax=Neptuniibacter sp. CAU 1671 TaxID=3032593 RepID=UPI0023DA900C|nr:paraquat-inducible protein A [Neptuniibacter sp. CAU 1671]MDF2180852.1 paraquat-inducible protein A [Neptuniibacter sp. CAU 1671]
MLLLTLGLLLAGLWLPMVTLTQLLIFDNTFSVISGISGLFERGNLLLGLLLLAFSVCVPLLKMGLLFRLVNHGRLSTVRLKRLLYLMHDYGRWAMLDVLVVAVLVVMVKLGAFASIEVHPGLYLFAGAVLMIMLLTGVVVKLHQPSPE